MNLTIVIVDPILYYRICTRLLYDCELKKTHNSQSLDSCNQNPADLWYFFFLGDDAIYGACLELSVYIYVCRLLIVTVMVNWTSKILHFRGPSLTYTIRSGRNLGTSLTMTEMAWLLWKRSVLEEKHLNSC